MKNIISKDIINKRQKWLTKIQNLKGDFTNETEIIENELIKEIKEEGVTVLIDYLRLCGNIPESYSHDSTEEKLYSKYTDILLSLSFQSIGFKSLVLKERGDAADVEVFGNNFSFVADAKAFRLSRTAKNQKDFKIQAMDNWKRGKLYAMVVCPIYQLPNRSSQIYQQAITRNVCIFTYSHLSLLLNYALKENQSESENLLGKIFEVISILNPSKNAIDYWMAINKTILNFSESIKDLWEIEKVASAESIKIAKEEGLCFLALEREKMIKMSHQEAINELIKISKIENKIKTIESINDSGLFSFH